MKTLAIVFSVLLCFLNSAKAISLIEIIQRRETQTISPIEIIGGQLVKDNLLGTACSLRIPRGSSKEVNVHINLARGTGSITLNPVVLFDISVIYMIDSGNVSNITTELVGFSYVPNSLPTLAQFNLTSSNYGFSQQTLYKGLNTLNTPYLWNTTDTQVLDFGIKFNSVSGSRASVLIYGIDVTFLKGVF